MIYSEAERKKKDELQSLLDLYKMNVEFLGSKEVLILNHQSGYKNLKHDIYNTLNAYIKVAIDGTHICKTTNSADILAYWKPHIQEIKDAIEEYSSDKVFNIIVEFISEMIWYYKGYIDLSLVCTV